MEFTGERFIPNMNLGEEIEAEHFHRYNALEMLVKGKKVLDAACGEGYGSKILSQFCDSIVGIDIDELTINNAKNKYKDKKNMSFINSSIEKLPFSDNTFDVVVSFETIEHVNEIIQDKFLKEVSRVLKDGGIFIISTPNKKIYSDIEEGSNHYHVKEFYKDEFIEFLNNEFKYKKVYGQYFRKFSILISEENLTESSKIIKEQGFEEEPKYFVVICSKKELEDTVVYNSAYMFNNKYCISKQYQTIKTFYKINGEFEESNCKTDYIDLEDKQIIKQVKLDNIDIKELRIDPMEINGVIKISQITLHLDNGELLDFTDKVTSNAQFVKNNEYTFLTNDPQMFIVLDKKYELKMITICYIVKKYDVNIENEFIKIKHELVQLNPNRTMIESLDVSKLYLDYGNGFNEQDAILFEYNDKEDIIIELPKKNVYKLRIDITEMNCCLRINKIIMIDQDGCYKEIDINTLNTNATYCIDNNYVFFNTDPYILINNVKDRHLTKLIIDVKIIDAGFKIRNYDSVLNKYIQAEFEIYKVNKVKVKHLIKTNNIKEIENQEKQKRIDEIENILKQKQKRIDEIENILKQKQKRIDEIENSRSWKYLKKIKKIMGK